METRCWPNPPCDCRLCRVCEMAGIAYPLARRPVVEPEVEAEPPRAERRPAPATLFDQLESEIRE